MFEFSEVIIISTVPGLGKRGRGKKGKKEREKELCNRVHTSNLWQRQEFNRTLQPKIQSLIPNTIYPFLPKATFFRVKVKFSVSVQWFFCVAFHATPPPSAKSRQDFLLVDENGMHENIWMIAWIIITNNSNNCLYYLQRFFLKLSFRPKTF